MDRDTAHWLKGQVDSINRLVDSTKLVIALHSTDAAKHMDAIRYSCNRTWHALDAAQDPEQEAKADGAARSTDGAA